ncbi:PaaI family thioesterase [Periweissella fabalis]|uniref:PaaI family thioesterase n=1 Tax=Periweissella fabalis TaxID=1070421 RepID=A0A7X6N518_9LACO|nr:PaaI family thioesterase [Periweissella fabalis]MCM0599830.1 PaaI family thioesterase [Periweissella fabalis]NKZ24115.1 PaaI family thioesterase [Periweissella fabalis]
MNLLDHLNIHIDAVDAHKTIISVSVTDALKQPYGIVHGGINAVLAETASSLAANAYAPANLVAVGVNINTNHLRPVVTGQLIATATPISLGRNLQTWQVEINQKPSNKLTSTSTVTTMLQAKPTNV